jgi:hypothetical protein
MIHYLLGKEFGSVNYCPAPEKISSALSSLEENLDSDALDFTALSYGGTEVGGNVGNREV